MNGGFASRSYLMVAPEGLGWGGRIRHDIQTLLHNAAAFYQTTQGYLGGPRGHGLLWLLPWDGDSQLDLKSLHPLFIEICRPIRLSVQDGVLLARMGTSKTTRINAKHALGNVGDPWLPL